MRIAIGSDHGGYGLKMKLVDYLKQNRHNVIDTGCFCADSCDYPKYCKQAAELVAKKIADRGVFICKSGIGSSIAANKVKGVRAALCYNIAQTKSSRAHNDANMLILGALYTDANSAKKMLSIWLKTKALGGRHRRRVKQIMEMEREQ